MRARIGALRIGPADVERAQFCERKILDARRRLFDPCSVRSAANLRLQPVVVKDDQLAIATELDVEFGAISAVARGIAESRDCVLRP